MDPTFADKVVQMQQQMHQQGPPLADDLMPAADAPAESSNAAAAAAAAVIEEAASSSSGNGDKACLVIQVAALVGEANCWAASADSFFGLEDAAAGELLEEETHGQESLSSGSIDAPVDEEQQVRAMKGQASGVSLLRHYTCCRGVELHVDCSRGVLCNAFLIAPNSNTKLLARR